MIRPSTILVLLALAIGAGLVAPASAELVLLMPESTNKTVQKFDPLTGTHLGTFLGPDDANLSTPQDCDINATGVLVSDQIDDAVRQYDFAGTFIGTFAGALDNLRGITAHNGRLYCTASTLDAIKQFDLNTGAPLGDFIATGVGGLNGPWDVLFRSEGDVLVTSIDSDNILRYDINGAPLGVFAAGFPFGEQMVQAQNGNILVSDFSRNAIVELNPAGGEVRVLTGVSGPRGCYELANGNVLTSNASGVYEVDRIAGGIVSTKLSGVGARMFQAVNLEPPVAVEPATWGGIKAQFK
jgi:hypothetical protein